MLPFFFNLNISISKYFEKLLYLDNKNSLLSNFILEIDKNDIVADIGGGKKPVKLITGNNFNSKVYEGLDFDINELNSAPSGYYSTINKIDLNHKNYEYYNKYDKIFCLNTIEHIKDVENALNEINEMLITGGKCYIRVPCKHALFAKLNLLLDENIKKRILFYIFPMKQTDGFPAYYNLCSINDFKFIFSKFNIFFISSSKKYYASSYFYFFFPLYLFWRLFTFFQLIFNDDYCESFEMILVKRNKDE
jgi:2-polyprenyl-6-hydroxyphenyl methylase/3-demethylubiquinone-9 3-methyltransferase